MTGPRPDRRDPVGGESRIDYRRLRSGEHVRELVELSRAFFEEYEQHHEDLFRIGTLRDDDVAGYFSRFTERDGHAAFVALRDGRLVGYITVCLQSQPPYWKVTSLGHISGLMVEPESRGRGIGARLVELGREYFREQGVRYFTVYTAAANDGAIRFYRELGLDVLHTHLVGTV